MGRKYNPLSPGNLNGLTIHKIRLGLVTETHHFKIETYGINFSAFNSLIREFNLYADQEEGQSL